MHPKRFKKITRTHRIALDLSRVMSVEALHNFLCEALEFPGWHGNNWNAFWDTITGLVDMPEQPQLIGWNSFEERFPQDAKIMRDCFSEMSEKYPEIASQIQYL